MATNRFNYNDKLRLSRGKVGINSTSPQEKLDATSGTLKAVDLNSSGITTFSTYEGFVNKKLSYTENVNIKGGDSGTLSGEIVVGSGLTMTVGSTGVAATTGQASIECAKVFNVFIPPCGGTIDRPAASKPGALYYNKDFKTIEYWDGNFWRQVDNTTRRGRGVFGGKSGGGETQFLVDSIQISTLGNSVDWGRMLRGRYVGQNCIGGETRVIFCGGYGLAPSPETSDLTAIDYGTFASGGQCADFGDLTDSRRGGGSCGSSTRGIYWGGTSGSGQIIDYLEIATVGNAQEFQDLGGTARGGQHCTSSATRGVCAANENDLITMNVITIASTGSFAEFGDYINSSYMGGFVSNGTRGVTGGGYNPLASAYSQTEIGYINIASGGNAIYFGELTQGRGTTGVANGTRGVFGTQNPSVNIIDYINFSTTGNALDFGDLVYDHTSSGIAGSDSHGGLGGF